MIASVRRAVLAESLMVAIGACDGATSLDPGPVATVPARGRMVGRDGRTATAGSVVLEPHLDGGSTNQATGAIQPDGTFVLGSVSPKDGAVPGKYRVKVEDANVKAK